MFETDYVHLVFILSDDMKGHARRDIYKILEEDDEYYYCNDFYDTHGIITLILEKNAEYVPEETKSGITCWGADERIVDYLIYKKWKKILNVRMNKEEDAFLKSYLADCEERKKRIRNM